MGDRLIHRNIAIERIYALYERGHQFSNEQRTTAMRTIMRSLNQMNMHARHPSTQNNPTKKLLYKSKALSKSAADATQTCQICFETRTKVTLLTTDCGHEYCRTCYESWINTPTSNKCCPTCRKDNACVTVYRHRATKQSNLIETPLA